MHTVGSRVHTVGSRVNEHRQPTAQTQETAESIQLAVECMSTGSRMHEHRQQNARAEAAKYTVLEADCMSTGSSKVNTQVATEGGNHGSRVHRQIAEGNSHRQRLTGVTTGVTPSLTSCDAVSATVYDSERHCVR